ncbi:BadF/BadG/BcrA/BcrD ATPase family protein [Aureimonas mangrovi]|uniref:BadF/BadG/BcrA/BcrD ATPase family protein n=1 Tax=Aureimonas mangrovi TaxID=2758041 RepID=UPI00163D59C9|nr:BadF/BadG/BcrA/BcrD ATPase family protein [Aureimonas mangrovi]
MTVDPLLVGVDGGGTNCRARIVTIGGDPVGEAKGGSANIFTDLEGACATIVATVREALEAGGLNEGDLARCHAGLGLAGANIPDVGRRFAEIAMPFAACRLASDAITGCLGAHDGADGGIAILGTGAAYVSQVGGTFSVFGGWGTTVSDQGSGADVGRAALRATLLAHDGVFEGSEFTEAVLARFDGDPSRLAGYAGTARARDFGIFAPLVFDAAEAGDVVAGRIVTEAFVVVEASLRRLEALGAGRIALLGGAAERYRRLMPRDLAALLVQPKGSALDGALILARQTVQ